jgi:autotransporter-associated beta strand protein
LIAVLACFGGGRAMAGGGGENMLLVVNPNDPSSLQIANAYAALRDIPSNNILFIAPPAGYQNNGAPIAQAAVMNTYLTPIAAAIAARGLTNQIDYIGTIGQATCYSIIPQPGTPYTGANSLNYALDLLTPLTDGSGLTLQNATYEYPGGPISALYQNPNNIPIGDNPAILHSATYSATYSGSNISAQYYMSGTIGYTGSNGNTAAQVIASLANGVAADGTRPAGTIYFEDNGDVRSTTRDGQWPATEGQLAARGVAWVYENNTPGATPLNRSSGTAAVLGAVCGSPTPTLPNGSTYLPGSWADNMTSFGCDFLDTSQTKATAFIAAGAAGTTGSVIEPYAIAARFTNSSIYTFIADGSTLGEALAKSVATPDIQMPLGDMLAQPFADVPQAAFTSSPGNYGPAAGNISVSGSASLVNPHIATGIGTLELLADGLVSSSGTLAAGSGAFNLNTTALADGVHEVRIVGINNSQAASEGYAAQEIVVDNHGRSIDFNGGNLTLTSSAATIGLAATAGDGTLAQVELTCLGRTVAQAAGSPGALSLSPTALAPGDNVLVPVAVFSDGMQVAGGAFVVHVESGTQNGWSNGTGSGLWSNPANWTGGVLPQNGDNVARFGGSASGGTVTVDSSASVEEIDLANSGSGGYTIAALPGQALTLATTNGPAAECLVNVLSGSHVISAPLVLAAPGNLVNVTNSTDCLTVSGAISGGGALTKTGPGLLLLAASNTYGGATTVSAGTLEMGTAAAMPGGTAATVNGTLDLGPFGATFSVLMGVGTVDHSGTGGSALAVGSGSFAGTIANSGGTLALFKMGSGQLALGGSNSFTGGTTVSAGTLLAAGTAALPGWASGAVTVEAGATLAVAAGGDSGWGNAQITALLGGVQWSSSAAAFGIDTTSGNATYGGNITQALGLTKLGANTLTLAGSNSYAGVTAIDGGILALGSRGALAAGNVTFGGGALQFTASNTTDCSAQFANSTSAPISIDTNGQAVTFGSSIAGSNTAGLVKAGNGSLTLGANNSYAGGTTVSGGTLVAASNSALGSGPVVLSPSSGAATLAFTSVQPSIGSLTSGGSGSSAVVLGNATVPPSPTLLTVGADNTSTTFSGAISDLISTTPAAVGFLTKVGSGTLLLTGVNTYSGTTTVAAGALSVAGTASLPGYNLPDKIGVAGGAVLAVQLGNGTTGWSNAQIASLLADVNWANSTAAFGIDTTSGGATYSGSIANPVGLTKLGPNVLVLTGNNTCSGATTVSGGTLSIGDGSTPGAGLASPSAGVGSGAALEFNLPDALTYGGTIGGAGQVLKAGAGQLTLSGNNSYSGGTTLTAGTLRTAGPAALAAASSLLLSGGTLDLGGNSFTPSGASIVFAGGVAQNGSLSYAGTYSAVPNNGTTATVSANLGGAAGLSMTGSGTLLLSGANLYSGGTTIASGTLEAATAASLPGYGAANAVHVAGGAVLAVQTSGGTTPGWNALQIGSLLASASWSNSTPNNAPALGIDTTNGDFTYGGSIPQAAGLAKLGANTLTLTAASATSGNLVSAGPGTLAIAGTFAFGGVDSSANPLGIVQIQQGQVNVLAGGALTNLSEIDLGDTPAQTGTLTLSGGTALVPYGSNYWSGVNVGYHGGTGILNLGGRSLLDATASNGSGFVNVVDIGFDNNNSTGSSGTVAVGGNSTLRAASGSFIVVGDGGTGVLAISQSGLVQASCFQLGSTLQSGQAGGSGALYLDGGTLSVPQVQNASGAAGSLYFNGGTLQASAASSDFLTLGYDDASGNFHPGGGTLNAFVQAGGAAIDTSGNAVTINQPLLHAAAGLDGGLTKAGSGTLTLTAVNTYNGGTTVTAGTLAVSSSANLGTGGLTFSGSGAGVLDIIGSTAFTSGMGITLSQNGTIQADDSAGATLSGPISGAGDLAKSGPGWLVLSGTNTYSGGTLVSAGTLVVAGNESLPDGSSLIVGANAVSAFFPATPAADHGYMVPAAAQGAAAVPEPGTLALLGVAGFVAAAAVWWRRWPTSSSSRPTTPRETSTRRSRPPRTRPAWSSSR